MATAIGLGFTLSASAQRMASGINAGVVELQKLGYQAKKTSSDVSVLKNLAIGQALISGIRSTAQQFTSFISSAAASAAAVDDLSKRTGISTQTLQGYGLAASQSGVSTELMGKSLQKLTVIQGKAQNGNKAAKDAFSAIGLSMQDLAGLSPEKTFEAVADAISQLPTVAQQSAAAVALFGKSGAELVPIFQEGTGYLAKMRREAEELGIVLSKEQMSGLAGLDDMIAKVTMAFGGLAQRIVAELVPQLLTAGDQMLTFVKTLDITAVTAALAAAIDIAVASFEIFTGLVLPLATTILQPLAAVLGFIADNMTGAAIGAGLAGTALAAYAVYTVASTIATLGFAAAITTLLSSTGIGVLVVAFGLLAGAVLQYSFGLSKATNQETKAAKALREQAAAAKKQKEDAIKAANQKQVTKLLNDEKIRKQFADVEKDADAFRKKLQESLQIKSTASLEVSDIRTKEGAAAVFALQAGRVDPAVEAAREQIKKLEEIKKAIIENQPDETVDILGGAE